MKAATVKVQINGVTVLFQSTPPVKAATRSYIDKWYAVKISIHAAREGGDYDESYRNVLEHISIHAAREGGDNSEISFNAVVSDFNPRRP